VKKLDFDNSFIRELPGDLQNGPGTRQVQGAAYSLVMPTPVTKPVLLGYSHDVAKLLGLDDSDVESGQFLQAFSGNAVLPGMEAYAANYGGLPFFPFGRQGRLRRGIRGAINLAIGPANCAMVVQ